MNRIKRKPLAEINVVPYIDVMLVLLVIFMITAPMLTQGVQVELPQAKAVPIETEDNIPIIISVDKTGQYFINDENQKNQAIGLQNLLVRVLAESKIAKQNHKKRPVLVRGDKAVEYGQVIALMATLKKAGIEQVGLMTESPGTQEEKT